MAQQFEGKVALITGGASGIGRATALAFAREGAKVVIADLDRDAGREVVQTIHTMGGEALFVRTDVSKPNEVASLIDATIATYHRLDFAHNNAGIEGLRGTTTECSEDNWDHVLDVNLKGVWLCMKYEIPEMLRHGKGAIVNTASVVGLVGSQGVPAYVAAKHGVIGLTQAAALEYARLGIRINAVCPASIATPMMDRLTGGNPEYISQISDSEPMGRLGNPEEVATAVLWLCSDASSFVTGHPLVVDGGRVAQ